MYVGVEISREHEPRLLPVSRFDYDYTIIDRETVEFIGALMSVKIGILDC